MVFPMNALRLLLSGAALGTLVAAQTPTFSSPANYLSTEGNSGDDGWIGLSQDPQESSQHTAIDATQVGTPRFGIRAAHWRRDQRSFEPGAVARTTRIGLRMAHAQYGNLRRGDFDDVTPSLTSPWSVVYAPKPTSIPDWTAVPSSTPAAFTFRLPFDVPFDYDGVDALAFQILGYQSSSPNDSRHPVDKHEDPAFYIWGGPDSGSGCMPDGNHEMRVGGQWWVFAEQDTSLRCGVDHAPAGQPVILNLGFSNPQIGVPGLCTDIMSSGEISVPLGNADAGGYVSWRLDFPHQASYVGTLDLHLQAWAFDPNAPVFGLAGSQGNQLAQYPSPPSPGLPMATSSVGVWTSGTTDFTDFVFWSGYGSIVTGWEN